MDNNLLPTVLFTIFYILLLILLIKHKLNERKNGKDRANRRRDGKTD